MIGVILIFCLVPSALCQSTPDNGLNLCKPSECVLWHQCVNGVIRTITGEVIPYDSKVTFDDDPKRANDQTDFYLPCTELLHTCCNNRSQTSAKIPIASNCGTRIEDGFVFRVDAGVHAKYGEFPWLVAILIENQQQDVRGQMSNVYKCGGSLIHPSVVLTAAHCVHRKDVQSLRVRAGEWDPRTNEEPYPHQDRLVAEVIIHEAYHAGGLLNDIALLFLTEPTQMADNVNTICLPSQDFSFDGTRCFASGWGFDEQAGTAMFESIPKRVELPIVPREQCERTMRTTRLGDQFTLKPSFICAGGESGRDTCRGDGGSPLVCPIRGTNHQYVQAGIVAWGLECGHDDKPSFYVNVPLFRHWIDTKMQAHNYNLETYTN